MPPSAYWGKRPREGDSDEAFVRFSELSPARKLERRREERVEKKERDRTLAYFRSVQRALEDQVTGGGDPSTLASIVDGFFSELLKLLKADSTFYILRNGTACRVVELALANALLLHVKSLLYVFLGHICELLISPVASYTLETLLASLSQGLSALAGTNREGLEAELTEGGVGMHTGSGVPSSATLLSSMAEEMCEHAEDLIVHDIGGRALRSVVLMLGGRPIRQAPLPNRPVAFPRIVGTLAEAVTKALEEGYGREYQTASPAEAWMAAAQVPATSLVMQSLLRVSDEGTVVERCVRQRIEQLSYKGKPLLHHLLVDKLGCHLFQSYLQVPPPTAVVVEGDAAAVHASASTVDSDSSSEATSAPGGDASCCWSRAAGSITVEVNNLLKPGSDLVAQTGYVLQDLVLYAPTATHLQWLWRRVLEPRLALLFDVPALTPVLVQLVKRCAFEGVLLTPPAPSGLAVATAQAGDAAASATEEVSHHGTTLPADVLTMLRNEVAQHVRYSPVPITFQGEVCASVCTLAKQRVVKGAAQYFLVDAALGNKGYEVAHFLLHLHPTASTVLQYSLDKLQRDDLLAVVCHQKGSLFMQQYIKVTALAVSKSTATRTGSEKADPTSGGADAAAAELKRPLMRLFRRLQSSLGTLIYDKYAAFVVEGLYEAAAMPVKEALVKSLVPLYQAMHTQHSGTTPAPSASAEAVPSTASATADDEAGENVKHATPSPIQQRFIAYKVMSKCFVEQYVHRRDDWIKLAKRQCHVQRLLCRMLLSE
ncbi:hypothetical protein LPMP_210210 [Leishmania panamensis]|uniref:RNA-binding protein, putative n=1 Tax=Leishmania panamensis TaxID=5679 RepID=A0A088RPU0_LEIPA|nr:hypothetical protein LPMP_210210 [Leishmania panamensis]AIN98102.1 hypothetical protein LPMP_210210 [Leishmania panamensis]